MLHPKLSVYLNRFYAVDGEIWFYSLYTCPPYSHGQSIHKLLHKRKKETPGLWVYGEINLLFSQLITSKMHVYQLSVTLSFWWITCITALLPIWFVFLAVLITKLHCWCIGFLHARLMALMNKREQPAKPMDKKMLKKKNKWRLLNKCKGKKSDWLRSWWTAWQTGGRQAGSSRQPESWMAVLADGGCSRVFGFYSSFFVTRGRIPRGLQTTPGCSLNFTKSLSVSISLGSGLLRAGVCVCPRCLLLQ